VTARRPVRISVVEGSGKGGMIHYDFQLCRALRAAGADPTLVTSTAYELRGLPHTFRVAPVLRLWDPKTGRSGSRVVRYARRALRGGRYAAEHVRLAAHLVRRRPDVVLFGEIRFAFEVAVLWALRRRGIPLAAIVHDVRRWDVREGSSAVTRDDRRALARWAAVYRRFDALFVHDDSNRDLFLRLYDVPPERVHTIHHPPSVLLAELPQAESADALRTRLGVPAGVPVVLFLGTISRYKGLDTLIRAMPTVLAAGPAHLVVAGFPAKDVDADGLRALARDLGVAEHVTWWLDYVPNDRVATLMAMSAVAVYPYRMITQSGAIQIAYSCGRPVVATRVGGLPDVVEDGVNGILVPPEAPEEMGRAVAEVLADPGRAARMGARSRELAVSGYSWDDLARRILEVVGG
jgi:glycosyltransferase involved in cell wall biosynthesis